MAAIKGPVLYSDFDAQRITFDKMSKTKRGSKTVKIGYAGYSSVLIQTPPLYLPMGVSCFIEDDGARENVSIPCSLRTEDPKVAQFVATLKNIEESVLKHCADNSVEIFGRQLSPDSISTIYTSPIKDGRTKPDGGNWPPLLRVKVSNLTPPRVFDLDKSELVWDPTPGNYKRYTARLILQLQPIWFVGKGFGISFRIQQMSVVDVPPSENCNMFIDDEPANVSAESDDMDDSKSE